MDSLLLSLHDYHRAARAKLPKEVLDYFEGGALDEITLRENTAGWERLKLYYHVLAGVGERDLRTTILGQPISMPIGVAPTAFQKLANAAGEIATAKAARAAGTLFILSSFSNTPMESVLPQAASPRWFQLYIYKDRVITEELVRRAEAAGAEAIVVTVDAPGLGTRERDMRNSFRLPDDLPLENLAPMGKGNFPKVTGSGLAAYVRENFKSDLRFEDLIGCADGRDCQWWSKAFVVATMRVVRPSMVRKRWSFRITAGDNLILRPRLAKFCLAVAAAVGDVCEVYVDGGIRRGSDVLKAIALGARAVLIGRPILWGLCVGGEQGATNVLEILRRELDEAMLLCGCTKLGDIGRGLLQP